MSESQVPWHWDAHGRAALRNAISEPRFSTYLLKAGGEIDYAFALYLYNMRLAEAFLMPLNIIEVTLRNAIDGMFVRRFGHDWPMDDSFRDKVLDIKGRPSLERGRIWAGGSRNQFVARISFEFWVNLFRSDYGWIWRVELNRVFPFLQKGIGRGDIFDAFLRINRFRNRVAHHEPIFYYDINSVYAEMGSLIDGISPHAGDWMRRHSTIPNVVRMKPKINAITNAEYKGHKPPECDN